MKDPEVVVLAAAPVPTSGIKWACSEYIGAEVLNAKGEIIKTREGLGVGDTILCPGLFGYFKAVVSFHADQKGYQNWGAQQVDGHLYGVLEFDIDDRHCWVCGGVFNLDSIQKLEIER